MNYLSNDTEFHLETWQLLDRSQDKRCAYWISFRMQEQHINCLEGCSIELPRMIYYTIDDMKKWLWRKSTIVDHRSIFLALYYSRYWTYALKKRHINWKRSSIIRRGEDMRKDPFSTPATIQHYPILVFLYEYI